ncbi:enzyme of heme biosynthesis [uncultured Alistipes sp.]|uniref:enzyme of heme biosynthesis n=1 Tax=uncultured Alistipes sp. TaxID=538949 RepID=UPI002618F30B|nr:enzyme of heme biosynthesis [uncultured Alistipes sp.]
MKCVKVLLSTALMFAAAVSVAQDFSDPRFAAWGDTPEQRKENILTSNLLKEAVDARDYDMAAVYFQTLAQQAPSASEATFIRGAQIYSGKVQRARSLDEKKVMLDSLMSIYDLRVQYFPNSSNYGKAYVLARKANEYLTYNPSDREGVRRLYDEAVAAGLESGYGDLSEVALIYFKNLCDDYKMGLIYPDVLLTQYERLNPIFANNDPTVTERRSQFDTLFAASGVANCENLEELFRVRIEAAPDDVDLLKQAVSLMAHANCDSPFFFEIAEKYYVLDPSSDTAMMLAQGFQAAGDYGKATTYLRETLAVETDPQKRGLLLVTISLNELAANRASAAATAATEARNLDPNNGMAYFALAQAYAAAASGCAGIDGQAVYWVAYDVMSQAANLLADDATYGPAARTMASNYRAHFPSAEELFFNELREGSRYTVTCGPASGISTTVRAR